MLIKIGEVRDDNSGPHLKRKKITMPRGYTGPPDPDKGKPYRHTQAKIRLMLKDIEDDPLALVQVILRLAEKRPEDVLDAVTDVLGEDG